MKKSGFTLIELLIVTVVIVTLMGIVFRLAGSGGESKARADTLSRLQKLSNALSGYYAAFGSYPPVPLQGRSRDIYTRVDTSGSMGYGIQHDADDLNTGVPWEGNGSGVMANQIEAACRAQPVAAICPYRPGGTEDQIIQTMSQVYHLPKIYKAIDNYGGFNRASPNWADNQAFMFGLLSFLLPRYQFMLDGLENIYRDHASGPWESNNRLPFLMNGTRLLDWDTAQKAFGVGKYADGDSSSSADVRAMLENLPSQAVCARWMPNLAGIVITTPVASHTTFFGVNTHDSHDYNNSASKWCIIGPNGAGGEPIYAQMKKTVADGWGEEFYYYSPPPYQSYQLWSSGPNKRTFPPWMEKVSGKERLINKWIADDIKVGDK